MVEAAKIAGTYKSGKLVSEEVLYQSLMPPRPITPREAWGMNPNAATNQDPKRYTAVCKSVIKFFGEVAANLYPDYVKTQAFQDKWMKTMMTWNAYANEIQYWLHSNPDYIALGHNNLNQDNAYFWRDASGKLDCGIIDWGGFGVGPLGHKMWWTFNCANFDNFGLSLNEYIDTFIAAYREHGGPQLDRKHFERTVLITSLGNASFMAAAVPNCYKMCPMEEFATITSRKDPRIAGNIDGKSTLRTTIHVLGCAIRAMEELGSDKVLQEFIQKVYVGEWKQRAKTDAMIFG